MALMAAHGEITPMPDCAIFADTQAEPAAVYKHLRWLMAGVLPFAVHVVTAGNLQQSIGATRPKGKFRRVDIPAYVTDDKGHESGLITRNCTRDFKIRPIHAKLKQLLGLRRKRAPGQAVAEQWIGISLDEVMRMKPNRDLWIANRWPLIEKRMSRGDCMQWLRRHGYPIPSKSACIFCPFHGDREWRNLTKDEFATAVEIDRRLRSLGAMRSKGELFLHRSCRPLDQVDLRSDADLGQLDLFNNECEGMCGV